MWSGVDDSTTGSLLQLSYKISVRDRDTIDLDALDIIF
jgi:hypothetical protein